MLLRRYQSSPQLWACTSEAAKMGTPIKSVKKTEARSVMALALQESRTTIGKHTPSGSARQGLVSTPRLSLRNGALNRMAYGHRAEFILLRRPLFCLVRQHHWTRGGPQFKPCR